MSSVKKNILVCSLLSFPCGAFVACGDDKTDAQKSADDACEHMEKGPPVGVTATVSETAAPTIKNDDKRYDVALVNYLSEKGGFVKFSAASAKEYAFYVNNNVPLTFKNASGNFVGLHASEKPFAACTDVVASYTYSLTSGVTSIEIGPTSETLVSFVVEELAAHKH